MLVKLAAVAQQSTLNQVNDYNVAMVSVWGGCLLFGRVFLGGGSLWVFFEWRICMCSFHWFNF